MKASLFLLLFIAFNKISFGQQLKQSIDYQYYRDDKRYYAFELFKNQSSDKNELMLNFTSNSVSKKIDKIYIQSGGKEIKLKFKIREEVISSDNSDFKLYPIIFNLRALLDKEIGCEAKIIFRMDNGLIYTLPFSMCNVNQQLALY